MDFLAGQAKTEGESDLKATKDVKSHHVEGDQRCILIISAQNIK